MTARTKTTDPRPRSRWSRDLVSAAAAALVALGARSSLADHYHVPTGSMIPTIEVGAHVLVNKLAYGVRVPFTEAYALRFSGPAQGDVVVLDSPESDVVLLKRVVAVPGDLVEVRGGHVSLNGKPAPIEDHGGELFEALAGKVHAVKLDDGGGPDFGPVKVPADRYLVLGDNRGNSHDGRMFGFVARERILGKASLLYGHDHGFSGL